MMKAPEQATRVMDTSAGVFLMRETNRLPTSHVRMSLFFSR